MTCIVGIQHRRRVVIAGDSAGVAGYSVTVRADEKVFERDGYLFGFCGSFRMGNILRYTAELPPPPPRGADLDAFLVREFVPAIRTAFKAVDNYMAVGCGDDLALGVLHATRRGGWEPEDRARLALEAAAYHSGGVCGPFFMVAA